MRESVRYAITRFQAVMASADRTADLVDGLTKLARRAASAHGVCRIPSDVPDTGFDWGNKAAQNTAHFMNTRRLAMPDHPELAAAVASLRQRPPD
ncbi:MAG TPA: hypothetical protein VIP05_16910 [Burkholderiaceae bacterium]